MSDENLTPMAETLLGLPPQDDEPETDPAEEIEPETTPEAGQDEPESSTTEQNGAETLDKLTVKGLAETLEITPRELYERLEVNLGDNKPPMSFGELKQYAGKLRQADDILTDARQQQSDFERSRLKESRAYQLLASRAGRQPTQAEIDEAQAIADNWVAEQQKALFKAKPGLEDAETRAIAEQSVTGLLGKYGFTEPEMEGFVEHRLFSLILDYAELTERLNKAQESEVKGKPASRGRRKPKSVKRGNSHIVGDYNKGRVNQTTAVAALIADGVKQHGRVKP